MSVVPVVDGYDLQRPFFSCRTDRGIGQVAEEYFFVLAECQEDELPVNISLISFQAAPRISYLEEEMMWIEVHLCDSRRGLIRRYVIDIRQFPQSSCHPAIGIFTTAERCRCSSPHARPHGNIQFLGITDYACRLDAYPCVVEQWE